MHHHKDAFQWKSDPYEYEFDKRAIDLILGSREVRQRVSDMESMRSLETSWQKELEDFRSLRRPYLLYPE